MKTKQLENPNKHMELIAEFPTTKLESPKEYVIDRDKLMRLRKFKLIQERFYVYLALKLSYDTSEPSIDIA